MWNHSHVNRDLVAVEFLQYANLLFRSNITFKTHFDFTHTSFEVVQASITQQHNTLHFSVCTALHQTDETILLTMFTEQLPDLFDCVNNPPEIVWLVGDMNIHCYNPLQSLT